MKKSSFTQHIPLLALALGSLALIVCSTYFVLERIGQKDKTFALADMQSVMDAQKLKWLTRMKEGETALVLEESKAFPEKLDQVLKTLAIRENVIILDKKAVVAGKDIADLTGDILLALNISLEESEAIRQELENDLLGDFPTMRKDHP